MERNEMNAPHRFVVYSFDKGEKIDLENVEKILSITSKPFYKLPKGMSGKHTFVVTVLDRVQNESKGYKCKTKL